MADKLPELVDLKLSKAEKKEQVSENKAPRMEYPWGLSISLDEDTMEKLGIKGVPGVGDEFHFVCVAHVTSARQSEYEESGMSKSIDLQLSDMAIIKHEAADEDDPDDSAAKESKEDDATISTRGRK